MSGNAHFPVFRNSHRFLILLSALVLIFSSSAFAVKEKKPEAAAVAGPKITDVSAASQAPDMNGAKSKPVDAVTVIGSRLPSSRQRINDMASNVTYIGKSDLDKSHPLKFQDAVYDLEGATFFDQVGNGWDTDFGLRGFRSSSFVNFLVDGVRVNEVDGNAMNFPLLAMSDIESIQVERGSASPVYGTGAFGGVVNLTTGRPSPRPLKIFGGLEWDSFQGLRFNQGFSGTLEDKLTGIGGKFKYYFNGGRNVGDGFRDNGEWRITSFDVKAEYELPEEQGRFYFGLKHLVDAMSNPGELTFQQYQDNADRTNKPLDGRKIRNTIIQLGADKKFLDDKILASIMGSWRPNRARFFSTSGTFTDPPFNPDTNLATTTSKDRNLTWQVQYTDMIREIAESQTLLGMEFRDQTQYALQQDAFQGNVVETSPRETERGANPDNIGIFWRETLNFFDKVIPYFGMRHDFHWLHTEDFLNPVNNLSRRWSKSTLSTGVTVHPVSFSDIFFNYSQGFRVPQISDIAPFNGSISANLEPETSDSFEVGTRLRVKELASYKISLFLIDNKNEIGFDSTAISALAPFGQNINIGKSRRYGIEQRIDLKPLKELALFGSATFMKAYVRETGVSNSPVDGRDFGQIPQVRMAWGGYVTPLARLGEPYSGLRAGLRGVFTGRQHPASYESTSQAILNATGGAGHFIKSYSVWDFILSYNWREKEIYFKINNLFDEKYYTRAVSATSFGTAIYPSGNFTFVNPGAPREFVLGSKWEF